MDDLKERYAPGGAFSLPIFQVMRTREPSWSAEVDADFIAQGTSDDEHAGLVSELGFQSYMSVPLRTRARIVGTLSLISTDPARRYGPEDVGTVMELAGRAALWIENARLYEDRDRTARVLQQSLLPLEIPAIPGSTSTRATGRRGEKRSAATSTTSSRSCRERGSPSWGTCAGAGRRPRR